MPPADDRAKSHESLKAALDLIDQGYSLMDGELRLLSWNAAFVRLLDFPAELVRAGVPIEALFRFNAERGEYGPGDPELQVAERVVRARRFEPHAFERVRPNGQVLHIRGVPVPEVGFVTIYSDVTANRRAERQVREHAAELERRVAERTEELRRSEAQLRLITDSIPALIGYFDARKAYRYINRGYQDWFGVDPAQPERASARRMLGDAAYAGIRPQVARALRGEATSFEYDACCVDGRVRRARTTLIPERTPDGAVAGCFELTFDVSEQRRTQELLAHAQKMEALGQLTGGLAHDFNNMLTVIVGNLGALRPRIAPAAAEEYLDPALAAARRGTELIRTLLGFARRQALQAQAAELGPLIELVVRLLKRSLPEALRVQVEEGPRLCAWIDPSRLQDALVNLILNARDAQAGTIRLRAALQTLSPERAAELQAAAGRYVRLDVIDDGQGMDARTRSRAFEPFFTTRPAGAGSGLGLAMVYGFVRQSEGAVEIASAPGRGTTVSLWLPQVDARPQDDAEAAAAVAMRGAAQALALLVEDDPEVRKVVRRSLVDLGFAVLEAENGAEALRIIDDTPRIDLLLSDVVMPGAVDGHAVARHARARQVPQVALMSAYVPGAPEGGVPMLAKPFTQRELAEFLQRHGHG